MRSSPRTRFRQSVNQPGGCELLQRMTTCQGSHTDPWAGQWHPPVLANPAIRRVRQDSPGRAAGIAAPRPADRRTPPRAPALGASSRPPGARSARRSSPSGCDSSGRAARGSRACCRRARRCGGAARASAAAPATRGSRTPRTRFRVRVAVVVIGLNRCPVVSGSRLCGIAKLARVVRDRGRRDPQLSRDPRHWNARFEHLANAFSHAQILSRKPDVQAGGAGARGYTRRAVAGWGNGSPPGSGPGSLGSNPSPAAHRSGALPGARFLFPPPAKHAAGTSTPAPSPPP
jgi:hypothetical protein